MPKVQESELSGANVCFYSYRGGNSTYSFQTVIPADLLSGRQTVLDGGPKVVQVETQNEIGTADGAFRVTLQGRRDELESVRDSLEDDDWCTIEFKRWDKTYATMAGPIDLSVILNGPYPQFRLLIVGRMFSAVWTKTKIFYDVYTEGSRPSLAATTIVENLGNYSPLTITGAILYGFLRLFATKSQLTAKTASKLPPGIVDLFQVQPGRGSDEASVMDMVALFGKNFRNDPVRGAPNLLTNGTQLPEITIWEMAMGLSDPALTEVYCDLLARPSAAAQPVPRVNHLSMGATENTNLKDQGQAAEGVDPRTAETLQAAQDRGDKLSFWRDDETATTGHPLSAAAPALVIRSRPYPVLQADKQFSNTEDFWRDLVQHTIYDTEISSAPLVRSGMERVNAVYLNIQSVKNLDLTSPVAQAFLNHKSIAMHGFRRIVPSTKYTPGIKLDTSRDIEFQQEPFAVLAYLKTLVDHYCLNHLFLAGDIELSRLRPDIRIGQRIRWLDNSDGLVMQGYVELVRHKWAYCNGETTVGVTRGFKGDDDALYASIAEERALYEQQRPQALAPAVSTADISEEITEDERKAKLALKERYLPNSPELQAVFTDAIALHDTSIPAEWATDPDLHALLLLEGSPGDGWIYPGIPNLASYGARSFDPDQWGSVRSDLIAGKINGAVVPGDTRPSSATGMGQLILGNARDLYPSGAAGIGDSEQEAVGVLRYILRTPKYGTPTAALAYRRRYGSY